MCTVGHPEVCDPIQLLPWATASVGLGQACRVYMEIPNFHCRSHTHINAHMDEENSKWRMVTVLFPVSCHQTELELSPPPLMAALIYQSYLSISKIFTLCFNIAALRRDNKSNHISNTIKTTDKTI